MSHYADRVQETTTTTGTGTITLGGAVSGFQSFSTGFASGSVVRYCIVGGAEWEVGEGVYISGQLFRQVVLSSSAAGAFVNFSSGTKAVMSTLPAASIVDQGVTLAMRNLSYQT